MWNFYNLLAGVSSETNVLRTVLFVTTLVIMALAAIATIVLILLQPGNSTGIDALGGSSETFFGKNKGKSIEAKMKKWTIICLVILLVFSVIFFVVPYNTAIWGA
jgi:preprotein translocase subunit SecG